MPTKNSRIRILLDCLGVDAESFMEFLEWALTEQIVISISRTDSETIAKYFTEPDGLKRFRNDLKKRTGRSWSVHDLNLLHQAVRRRTEKQYRDPVTYAEYLKLLWTVPHECRKCGRKPPEVKLHIDHIIPVWLGGPSKRHNIQFLCQDCNLRKSGKLEGGEPWLDLR